MNRLSIPILTVALICTVSCDWQELVPGADGVTDKLEKNIDDMKTLARMAENAVSVGKTLTPDQVRSALQVPMSADDVESAQKLLNDYRLTPEYLKFKNDTENVKHTAKSQGKGLNPSNGVSVLKSGLNLADGHKSLMIAYQQLLDRNGGPTTVLPKLARVGAITSAARFIAKEDDAASDQVAKKMIADQSRVKKEVMKDLEAARKQSKKSSDLIKDFDPKKFNLSDVDWAAAAENLPVKTARHSGALALAFLTPKSLTAWKEMSVDDRRAVLALKKNSIKEIPAVLITVTHFSGENLVYLAGLGDLVQSKQ